jgi:hypothetical protein
LDIKRHNVCKMGTFEYELLINHYKVEVEELKKQLTTI